MERNGGRDKAKTGCPSARHKGYRGVEVQILSFLTSALEDDEWSD
jgi:hypothetical protein